MKHSIITSTLLILLLNLAACGGVPSTEGTTTIGGDSNAGGSESGTGGSNAVGGATQTGVASNAGGTTSTGGTETGSGGNASTGGKTSAAAGDTAILGGSTGTGGESTLGGAATGGTTNTVQICQCTCHCITEEIIGINTATGQITYLPVPSTLSCASSSVDTTCACCRTNCATVSYYNHSCGS